MQKKLIALAVASALTVPALALADTGNVTIYGTADVSYDFVNAGNLGTSSQRVSSNTSNIGLKGSEDLGGGLSAVWQVEQLVDISGASNATNGFATRNTFIGLSSGSLGTVVLGRHDTPYKIATRGLDVFANGIADNRSLMGQSSSSIALSAGNNTATAFDGRQPNVIAYISPAMAGLTVAVGHVNLNQTLGLNQSVSPAHNSGAWSVAGLYGNGPFFGSLAYEKHDLQSFTAQVGAEEKAWKLGLGYTQEAFNVGLAYEKTSDNLGGATCTALTALASVAGDCAGHNAWYLGGKYNFTGSDAVKLAYTKMGNMTVAKQNAADTSAHQLSVGYDHNMSKRTTVYALYTKLSNGRNGGFGLSSNSSAANMSVNLATGVAAQAAGSTVGAVGSSPSAVSFGLRHTFEFDSICVQARLNRVDGLEIKTGIFGCPFFYFRIGRLTKPLHSNQCEYFNKNMVL